MTDYNSLPAHEYVIDASGMRCTICNARAGTCGCWTECRCGWRFRTGGECRNTVHICEAVAGDVAATVLTKLEGVKVSQKAARAIEAATYDAVFNWAGEFLKPPAKAKK